MHKLLEEHSKSIDELYKFIALIESCLEDLEKRVSELEKEAEHNGDYQEL